MFTGTALVCKTAIVCGCVSWSTKNTLDSFLDALWAILMASAAAVGSSNNDAFETARPVKS